MNEERVKSGAKISGVSVATVKYAFARHALITCLRRQCMCGSHIRNNAANQCGMLRALSGGRARNKTKTRSICVSRLTVASHADIMSVCFRTHQRRGCLNAFCSVVLALLAPLGCIYTVYFRAFICRLVEIHNSTFAKLRMRQPLC